MNYQEKENKMRGILSPILSHIVQTSIAAVGEKERLSRLINKYRKMLRFVSGGLNISEVRFGLADLLITRDDENDWHEAKTHYDYVLEYAPYGYLRSAATIGKAELAIRSSEKKEIDNAIELSQKAYKNLTSLVGPNDFYSIKCLVVEAELRVKRRAKGDIEAAVKLFEKAFKDELADSYFRARAIVGYSEIFLYAKEKNINKQIQLLHEAIELLEEHSADYFCIKAKLIQGEYIMQRMASYDKSRATGIMMGIIGNKNADNELKLLAKLDLAEISTAEKAKKMIKEVLSTPNLDAHIKDKAHMIENRAKK